MSAINTVVGMAKAYPHSPNAAWDFRKWQNTIRNVNNNEETEVRLYKRYKSYARKPKRFPEHKFNCKSQFSGLSRGRITRQ